MRRRILFYLLFFVGLFLLSELIARAYYYGKPAQNFLASYQLLRDVKHSMFPAKRWNPNGEYFVRPNLPKKVSDSIAMETDEADRLIYQPWISFTSINSKGNYVNVFNQIRKSSPDVSTGSGADTTVIWFLGGSTTFGVGVTDAETIPAAFVHLWQQRSNRPIRVMNYATPLYYSYQELILLADNLFRGKIPQMVIMLDGLNDCGALYSAYHRYPSSIFRMQQLLNPELYKNSKNIRYSDWPDTPGHQIVSDIIFQQYLENIANVKKLADEYKIQLYCFWQPVPYYNYKNRSLDPFCAKANLAQYDFIYPLAQDKAKQIDYLYYLGETVNAVRYPFLDSVHYTPKMCEAIAKRMLDSISASHQSRNFEITK